MMAQPNEPEKQDIARKELYEAQKKLLNEVKGPYFFGQQFTLADIAITPWVVRDHILVEYRGYRREDVGNGWVKYAEALSGRDSVLKTTSVS